MGFIEKIWVILSRALQILMDLSTDFILMERSVRILDSPEGEYC